MLNYYFGVPFADGGDKAAIPSATQPDGSVSMTQGFGPNYELPYSDPNSKDVPRDKSNQLNWLMTKALQEYQQNGVPDWIDPSQNGGVNFAYPIGARVRYLGNIYISAIAANNLLPTNAAGWIQDNGRVINVRLLTTTGSSTYTPTVGTKSGIVAIQGAGGAGGAAGNTSAGACSAGAGGSSGGLVLAYIAAMPATVACTIGVGGVGAVGPGGAGGASSFGAFGTAGGGGGGGVLNPTTGPGSTGANAGGSATGGNILNRIGRYGEAAKSFGGGGGIAGSGAASWFGSGAPETGAQSIGANGAGYGSGGSGGFNNGTNPVNYVGGNGSAGCILVIELG